MLNAERMHLTNMKKMHEAQLRLIKQQLQVRSLLLPYNNNNNNNIIII